MDDRKFDSLARMVGKGASRRSILKGLLGLGGAAVTGTIVTEGTDARGGSVTRFSTPPDPDCVSGWSPCGPTGACCPDAQCHKLRGVPDDPGICCDPGESRCGSSTNCCAASECKNDGTCCLAGVACGNTCCDSADVCSVNTGTQQGQCCAAANLVTANGECCDVFERNCDTDCCGPDDICLTRVFRPSALVKEETCCPVELTCDDQCCTGECYSVNGTLIPTNGIPGLNTNRLCCPAGGEVCNGLFDSLCCEGDTPTCCVGEDGTPSCRAVDACCTDDDCPDNLIACEEGVCGPLGACRLQSICEDGEQCCEGTRANPGGVCRAEDLCCVDEDCLPLPDDADACTEAVCGPLGTCRYPGCGDDQTCCTDEAGNAFCQDGTCCPGEPCPGGGCQECVVTDSGVAECQGLCGDTECCRVDLPPEEWFCCAFGEEKCCQGTLTCVPVDGCCVDEDCPLPEDADACTTAVCGPQGVCRYDGCADGLTCCVNAPEPICLDLTQQNVCCDSLDCNNGCIACEATVCVAQCDRGTCCQIGDPADWYCVAEGGCCDAQDCADLNPGTDATCWQCLDAVCRPQDRGYVGDCPVCTACGGAQACVADARQNNETCDEDGSICCSGECCLAGQICVDLSVGDDDDEEVATRFLAAQAPFCCTPRTCADITDGGLGSPCGLFDNCGETIGCRCDQSLGLTCDTESGSCVEATTTTEACLPNASYCYDDEDCCSDCCRENARLGTPPNRYCLPSEFCATTTTTSACPPDRPDTCPGPNANCCDLDGGETCAGNTGDCCATDRIACEFGCCGPCEACGDGACVPDTELNDTGCFDPENDYAAGICCDGTCDSSGITTCEETCPGEQILCENDTTCCDPDQCSGNGWCCAADRVPCDNDCCGPCQACAGEEGSRVCVTDTSLDETFCSVPVEPWESGVCCDGTCIGGATTCEVCTPAMTPGEQPTEANTCSNTDECCEGSFCCRGYCIPDGACCSADINPCGECEECFLAACQPLPNETPCDDGNVCTFESFCISGVCISTSFYICLPFDECSESHDCNPDTGCPDQSDCGPGEICNPQSGECEATTTTTSTCPPYGDDTSCANGGGVLILADGCPCSDTGICRGGWCCDPELNCGTSCCSGDNECVECQGGVTCAPINQGEECNGGAGVCSGPWCVDPPTTTTAPICTRQDLCQGGQGAYPDCVQCIGDDCIAIRPGEPCNPFGGGVTGGANPSGICDGPWCVDPTTTTTSACLAGGTRLAEGACPDNGLSDLCCSGCCNPGNDACLQDVGQQCRNDNQCCGVCCDDVCIAGDTCPTPAPECSGNGDCLLGADALICGAVAGVNLCVCTVAGTCEVGICVHLGVCTSQGECCDGTLCRDSNCDTIGAVRNCRVDCADGQLQRIASFEDQECVPRDYCNSGECGIVDAGCGQTIRCDDCTTPAPAPSVTCIPADQRISCTDDTQCCEGLCRNRGCNTRGGTTCTTHCSA